MITLNNIRIGETETKFYAPPYFAANIALLFDKCNVSYEYIQHTKTILDKNSLKARTLWAERFKTIKRNDTKYVDVIPNAMDCIVSYYNTDNLFDLSKQFIGPTVDIDFKRQQELLQKESEEDYCNRYHTTLE